MQSLVFTLKITILPRINLNKTLNFGISKELQSEIPAIIMLHCSECQGEHITCMELHTLGNVPLVY